MTWDELNRVSTRVNRLLGGDDEPVCARVYFHARTWGGSWLTIELLINLAFLPWERFHVEKAYQRRLK